MWNSDNADAQPPPTSENLTFRPAQPAAAAACWSPLLLLRCARRDCLALCKDSCGSLLATIAAAALRQAFQQAIVWPEWV